MKYKLIILLCIISAIGGFFTAYFQINADQAWVGILFNFLISIPVWISLINLIGWQKAISTFIGFGLLAILIESIAIISCIPYGCFNYYENIGPRLVLPAIKLGEYSLEPMVLAPWGLVLAFLSMLFGAYGLASYSQRINNKPIFRVILALIFLISLDLLIDPLAVRLKLWYYHNEGGWFGVPWSNFGGWVITGSIFLIFCEKILKGRTAPGFLISFWLIISFWISVALTLFVLK